MTERFPDEVLREAIAARFKVLESREAHRIGFGTIEQLEAEQVEGLDAMRAVLEGHLAAQERHAPEFNDPAATQRHAYKLGAWGGDCEVCGHGQYHPRHGT